MPIFQDTDSRKFYDLWSLDQQTSPPENACWIDYHEGDSGVGPLDQSNNTSRQCYLENHSSSRLSAHGREELIHYIKTAETSRWSQYPLLRDSGAGHHMPPTSLRHPAENQHCTEDDTSQDCFRDQTSSSELASPAEIERPRSALHSGDFREGASQQEGQHRIPQSPLPTRNTNNGAPFFTSSPTTPWFTTPSFPSRTQTAPIQVLEASVSEATRSPVPSRGSFSSNYVLKVPTSPLVHQANNADLDFSSGRESGNQTHLLDKANRRRTLPPDTFRDLRTASTQARSTQFMDAFSDYSKHYRRSLASSYSLQAASSFHGQSLRPRRPSVSSEVSGRTHAPMVGSYEESILRGRMSTCPSKPLDFTAQIGVLGKSKCKASLKCPPHVTVPFPAVFYSYPTSGNGRTISDDSPSPYVGTIDLENSLPRDTSSGSRRRKRHQSPVDNPDSRTTEDLVKTRSTDQETLRRREKRHRRAESPKSPSGGCYRIPQQGQLQVMIKNPNKTAVKLFLIPYDLSDMEPGTKTFIRQRSYSASPMLDMPLSARSNYGTDRPEASLTNFEDPKDKPILRYLIHLNICSPSRGRFYLHSSIRVVFANRVPDGKETLRNEIQHPEPRYSPYKLAREPNPLRVRPRSGTESRLRSPSPHPTGNYRPTEERPLHPFQPIPSIRNDMVGVGSPAIPRTQAPEFGVYNKPNIGDVGYGGYQPGSLGSSEGGSLLAKRLRKLDVQRPDVSPERPHS
ncbi:hypothetical protein BJX70DRAFT_320688 [Aspergillus crustosus]